MKAFSLLLLLMTGLSFATESTFFVGAYTGPGKADGILKGRLNLETGALSPLTLAAKIDNPSYLALTADGKNLYAALEGATAAVAAFRIDSDTTLASLNQQRTGGQGTCHVFTGAGHVFAASYNSGDIAVFPIQKDGSLGARSAFIAFQGTGPNQKRQTKSHAHGMLLTSDGKFAYACDLGSDHVWSFQFDAAKGALSLTPSAAGIAPPGSGPRHMALNKDETVLYANNEMTVTVTAYRRDPQDGTLKAFQTLSALPEGVAPESASVAEIQTHPNGRWLYVSNRGHDSLTVFEIKPDGSLAWVENVPALVHTPRGFSIDPTGQWLVTAGQDDNKLAVLKIDPTTGKLTATDNRADAGAPVSIAFLPSAKP